MAPEKKRPAEASAAGKDAEKQPSFEEAIERLETIVDELEGGSLSLEESIARYEEGMRLSKHLTRTLDEAEKRIERLTEGGDGAPSTQPMEIDLKSPENASRQGAPKDVADDLPEGKLPF